MSFLPQSEDQLLSNAADALERQLNYQTQIGGNPLSREPGRFVLNERMGVMNSNWWQSSFQGTWSICPQ